jgi:hypothetical protein
MLVANPLNFLLKGSQSPSQNEWDVFEQCLLEFCGCFSNFTQPVNDSDPPDDWSFLLSSAYHLTVAF